MAGIKSVYMFHDVFHENSRRNEDQGRFVKAIQMEYLCQEQYDHQLRRLERRQ